MATIHLITVADLNDVNIGDTCALDLKKVQELIQEASDKTGMALEVTEVIGENFDADHIKSAIHELLPGRNDTVVFYYSGHGARGESKEDAWPVLSLGSRRPPFACFDLSWIYTEINKKRPRMLLMFVDCCQQLVPDDMLLDRSRGAIRDLVDIYSVTNFHLLFQLFEGEVLLMSCKPGQLSGCNAERGGFFTATFVDAFHSAVKTVRAATWEGIAAPGCLPPTRDQEPIWKVVTSAQLSITPTPGMEPFPGTWTLGRVLDSKEGIAAAGSRNAQACATCRSPLAEGARFCPNCGAKCTLPDISAPAVASASHPATQASLDGLAKTLDESESRLNRMREQSEARLAQIRDRWKDR